MKRGKNNISRSKLVSSRTLSQSLVKDSKGNENPFDKFNNARKKHEILNRRVKGDQRNVGKAKLKAVTDRKSQLLNDFKKNNKSNVFIDKRFGETDANLSLEDKMFMRFQKEKIRKTKSSSIYNLDSSTNEMLTHHGEVLGSTNLRDRTTSDDDEDDEDYLDKEIVDKLHFGGGFIEKSNDTKFNHFNQLQEIISKSKQHKQQLKEAKTEQFYETERLDEAFRDLVKDSSVSFRPTRGQKGYSHDSESDNEEPDDYDKSLAIMAFESKAQATDRIKSVEEIALEEKKKLEELERQRKQRMIAPENDENEEEEDYLKDFVSKDRKRQRTDDDIDHDVSYNKKMKYYSQDNNDQVNETSEDDREEEDENEEDNDDSDGSDDDVEGEDYEIDDYDQDIDPDGPSEAINRNHEETSNFDENDVDSNDEEDEDDENDDEHEASDDIDSDIEAGEINDKRKMNGNQLTKIPDIEEKKQYRQKSKQFNLKSVSMPAEIPCPSSSIEFYDLIDQYTTNLSDIQLLIDRILIWNSVLLPGLEGTNNRVPMHNFLDILIKYFIKVGDSLVADDSTEDGFNHINYLTKKIFKLCQDIHEVVPSLFGRWIKQCENQLQKKLRDYTLGEQSTTCYPSLGQLLMFQFIRHVFSITDHRHSIISSVILFFCQCLSQCPVSTICDISSGLMIVSILIDYIEACQSYRFIPELLPYLTSILSCYNSKFITKSNLNINKTINRIELCKLRHVFIENQDYERNDISHMKIPWKWFRTTNYSAINSFNSSIILMVIYRLIDRLICYYNPYPSHIQSINDLMNNSIDQESITMNAFTELFQELMYQFIAMKPNELPNPLPKFLQEYHIKLLTQIINLSTICNETRSFLQWRKPVKHTIINKLPEYDPNYKLKKDQSIDQQTNLLKQLKRQLKREKKSTIRELKRDNEYLDQLRYQQKTNERLEQQQERWKNYSWMEQQQAVLNMHVKKFKGDLKGGGSNGHGPSKTRRVSRGEKK